METPTPVTPLSPAIPITHQDHPVWSFNWAVFLQVLQAAAVIAPAVVAITDAKNPDDVAKAEKLGALAGAAIGGFSPAAMV